MITTSYMFISDTNTMRRSKIIIPKLEIQFFHILQIVTSNQLTEEERNIPELNGKGNFCLLVQYSQYYQCGSFWFNFIFSAVW